MINKSAKSAMKVFVVIGASFFMLSGVCLAADITEALKNLKDKDATKRAAAAIELGKSGDPKAVEPLMEALKAENASAEENDKTEKYIIKALGALKDPRAVDLLISVISESEEGEAELDEDEAVDVKEAAVIALGEIGDTKAVKELEELLESKQASINKAAKNALEKIKGKK